MNTNTHSSQAGLASLFPLTPKPSPTAKPVKIYAAVIEWPSEYADYDAPALIMERSHAAMMQEIRATVQRFAGAFDETTPYAVRLRVALSDMAHLEEDAWLAEAPFYDEMPFITTHEREI